MLRCRECRKQTEVTDLYGGVCNSCRSENSDAFLSPADRNQAALDRIVLTTETVIDLPIAQRVAIVSAECVMGMNVFRDLGSLVRDVVGGRDAALQKALRDAREDVLSEIRRQAHELGADAVIAVDLDYSEISGGGKSMLFLVATGTAVRLQAADR